MPDASTYALFVAAALALLLVPGPAVIYVVARSVSGGRLTGLVSVLGVELGTLLHVALRRGGALGDSGLLGGRVLRREVARRGLPGLPRPQADFRTRRRGRGGDAVEEETRPTSRVFYQSVLVQVLNPKVALFFLAFLPQFVDPSRGAAWTQIVVLGATLAFLGMFTDGLYALLGGTAGAWIRNKDLGLRRAGRYVTGGVYIALGAVAAVSGKD